MPFATPLPPQATKDLENYDAERHEEFKRYEMLKEHERRQYLKGLDQEKREEEERRLRELQEKHRQHPKINAPVREGGVGGWGLLSKGGAAAREQGRSFIIMPSCNSCTTCTGSRLTSEGRSCSRSLPFQWETQTAC